MKTINVSLIIVSCKSYEDVLSVTIEKLKQFDTFSIRFASVILASDEKSCDFLDKTDDINDVVYDKHWGGRVRKALFKIKSDFCFVILDDYLPNKPINEHILNKVISQMHDFDCIYLTSVLNEFEGEIIDNLPGFRMLSNNCLYRVNTTAGLWKKESLLKILSDRDSPWEWEAFAGLSNIGKAMKFAGPMNKESQVYSYSYETGGSVYRGNWVKSALIGAGYNPDNISAISSRPIIERIENTKRSFVWKLQFLKSGINMIGFRVLNFILLTYLKKVKSHRKQ